MGTSQGRATCSGSRWQRATLATRRAWAATARPCALCHQPIDYSLRHPHKRALTVDHIVSLDDGGPAMDPRNWQPAHLSCNSRRGAAENKAKRARPKHTSTSWR